MIHPDAIATCAHAAAHEHRGTVVQSFVERGFADAS